jgi:hypothetical protein
MALCRSILGRLNQAALRPRSNAQASRMTTLSSRALDMQSRADVTHNCRFDWALTRHTSCTQSLISCPKTHHKRSRSTRKLMIKANQWKTAGPIARISCSHPRRLKASGLSAYEPLVLIRLSFYRFTDGLENDCRGPPMHCTASHSLSDVSVEVVFGLVRDPCYCPTVRIVAAIFRCLTALRV